MREHYDLFKFIIKVKHISEIKSSITGLPVTTELFCSVSVEEVTKKMKSPKPQYLLENKQ